MIYLLCIYLSLLRCEILDAPAQSDSCFQHFYELLITHLKIKCERKAVNLQFIQMYYASVLVDVF